jgi:hypothetical protein
VRPAQSSPLAQVRPVQQGWPWPPQVWQVSPLLPEGAQAVPAVVHRLSGQHRSPVLPHATQALLLQTVLPAVQRLFEQQGSPSPPQRPPPPSMLAPPSSAPERHAPAEQVRLAPLPELAHAVPAAAQVAPPPPLDVQQQPPLPHRLPAQQVWPAPPQI